MAIVLRFVDDSFVIQQRLIRLQLFVKSMTGKEIARELINTLSAQYNIGSDLLVAAMHDHAACNMFALRTLTVMFHKLADVGCFSHMLDLLGEKFTTPHLLSVMVWWISLFSHSPKSVLLWTEKTGQACRGYSPNKVME